MPRPRCLKPAYCINKSDGRAFVTLDGHRVYLGKHGTQESHDRYDAVVGEWIQRGRRPAVDQTQPSEVDAQIRVGGVVARFWTHAKETYPAPPVPEKRRPAGELGNHWDALRPLLRLFRDLPAAEFGPLKLKVVRDEMIRLDWCRNRINRQVGRLKHVFKWAVENEPVPPAVYEGLKTVAGLKAGRSKARETEPVKSAPPAVVAAVMKHLPPTGTAMVELQNLTGMRPTELCTLRTCDIDTNPRPATDDQDRQHAADAGAHWMYRPPRHKTAFRGHVRAVPIGPRAQAILGPFLKPDLQAYVFSPAESEQDRHARMRERRLTDGTPLTPSQAARQPTPERKRPPGLRYDRNAYRRAVQRACDAAFPPPGDVARRENETLKEWKARLTAEQRAELKAWRKAHRFHPHQLRHGFAERVRQEFGAEAAQQALGHKTLKATEVYAERNEALAAKVASRIG